MFREHLVSLRDSKKDRMRIHADFDEYCKAQEQIDQIFLDKKELCKRSLTAVAKCGDLSCDNSIVQYCQQVWSIKSVEVPNPALNPVSRVRSHSYLHMQEGSMERGDESYSSNMFNLEEHGRVDNHSIDSRGDSVDKLYNKFNENKSKLIPSELKVSGTV